MVDFNKILDRAKDQEKCKSKKDERDAKLIGHTFRYWLFLRLFIKNLLNIFYKYSLL